MVDRDTGYQQGRYPVLCCGGFSIDCPGVVNNLGRFYAAKVFDDGNVQQGSGLSAVGFFN